MKTIVFGVFFLFASLGYSQGHVELSFSVTDEDTERKLDSAFVHVYLGDSLIDADSSGYFFGHFKSFRLEYGHQFSFVVSKEGYVSKMATVDTRHPEQDSLPWRIQFPCFVGLFPDCEIADYDFLKTTPLIKMYIDSAGNQAWDRDYVHEMQLKISAASHAYLADDQYDKYSSLYYDGQSMIEFQMYDSALIVLEQAREIVDCYKVQRAITECLARKDGKYNTDTLKARYNRYEAKNDYRNAANTYNLWVRNLGTSSITSDVAESVQYYKLLVRADDAMNDRNYRDASYYYERAIDLEYKKDAWVQARLDEVNKLKEEQSAEYERIVTEADAKFDAKEYKAALELYQKSLDVKPSEYYPKDQIRRCEELMSKEEAK